MPVSTCIATGSFRPRLGAAARHAASWAALLATATRPASAQSSSRAGIDTVENVDFWLRAKRLPERNAFRRMRDEEYAAAFLAKGGSDLGRAEPITVRLDDGGASGALKASLQPTIVLADGAQIDGEDRPLPG